MHINCNISHTGKSFVFIFNLPGNNDIHDVHDIYNDLLEFISSTIDSPPSEIIMMSVEGKQLKRGEVPASESSIFIYDKRILNKEFLPKKESPYFYTFSNRGESGVDGIRNDFRQSFEIHMDQIKVIDKEIKIIEKSLSIAFLNLTSTCSIVEGNFNDFLDKNKLNFKKHHSLLETFDGDVLVLKKIPIHEAFGREEKFLFDSISKSIDILQVGQKCQELFGNFLKSDF
jgi:hypothetical protein